MLADLQPWPLVTVPHVDQSGPTCSRKDFCQRFLDAISAVETGGQSWKIGLKGERSEWQMKRKTWYCYTRVSFTAATTNCYLAASVARKHLAHLIDLFGTDVCKLAMAWHYGEEGALGRSKDEYAIRVLRLFNS